MSVSWLWVGRAEHNSFQVKGEITGSSARLVVSANSNLSSPTYFGPVSPASLSGMSIVTLNATGLSPFTLYHYAIEVDSVVDTNWQGKLKTAPVPGTATSFKFWGFACAGNNNDEPSTTDKVSNRGTFLDMLAKGPDFGIHFGDFHYRDIESTSMDPHRTVYADVLTYNRTLAHNAVQGQVYRNCPIVLGCDDHEFGPNDSDTLSSGREQFQKAYREIVPSHTLPAVAPSSTNYQGGVWHSFVYGRVRFLITDLRTERSPQGATDNEDKIMMGAEQEAWFMSELQAAKDSNQAVCWFSSVPWIAANTTGGDHWGGFNTMRTRIVNKINELQLNDKMFIIAGDMHALAIDDGRNNQWGGFPVFHYASMDANPSSKGGPYWKGPSQGRDRYGITEITDDGSIVTVRGTGYIGSTEWDHYEFTINLADTPNAFTSGQWGVADTQAGGEVSVTISAMPASEHEITKIEYRLNNGSAVTLAETASTDAPPDAFVANQWDVTHTGAPGEIGIGIFLLPSSDPAITDIRYRLDGGAAISLNTTTTGDKYVSGLNDGQTYNVQLSAVNSVGAGEWSDTKTVTPVDTGAEPQPEPSYPVPSAPLFAKMSGTSITVPQPNNTVYRYHIGAINEWGDNGPFEAVDITIAVEPEGIQEEPGLPPALSLSYNSLFNTVYLRWSKGQSFRTDLYYTLERRPSGGSYSTVANFLTLNGHTDSNVPLGGTTSDPTDKVYEYRVRATNSDGSGAWSNVVTVVVRPVGEGYIGADVVGANQIKANEIYSLDQESLNYIPGAQGWKIDRNGYVEFDTGVFRGLLRSADWDTTTGVEFDLANKRLRFGGSASPKIDLNADTGDYSFNGIFRNVFDIYETAIEAGILRLRESGTEIGRVRANTANVEVWRNDDNYLRLGALASAIITSYGYINFQSGSTAWGVDALNRITIGATGYADFGAHIRPRSGVAGEIAIPFAASIDGGVALPHGLFMVIIKNNHASETLALEYRLCGELFAQTRPPGTRNIIGTVPVGTHPDNNTEFRIRVTSSGSGTSGAVIQYVRY